MNHLTNEERAALYERALEKNEQYPLGVEYWMVELQRRDEVPPGLKISSDIIEEFLSLMRPIVEQIAQGIIAASQEFQQLWESIGHDLSLPRCDEHDQAILSGLCPGCLRSEGQHRGN